MSKILTQQEAALYLGQDIHIELKLNGTKSAKGKLTYVDLPNIGFEGSIYTYKLLLRPLSDLTQEETQTGQDIFYNAYKGNNSNIYAQAKRINYLRSIGIDCDNLIEQGNAIDKTLAEPFTV